MNLERRSFSKALFNAIHQVLILTPEFVKKNKDSLYQEDFKKNEKKYFEDILKNRDAYIEIIQSFLIGWKFKRLNGVDQTVLLLGTYYIINDLCDAPLVIDRSLEYIKQYSDKNNYAYVNAVLDKIRKMNNNKEKKKN